MAEDVELSDLVRQKNVNQPEDDEATTSFIIPDSGRTLIHKQEVEHERLIGSSLEALRRELLKTKVNAFLKVVAAEYGLLPVTPVYDEFVLGEDGRALFRKDGHIQVTWKKDSTRYRALKSLGRANWIRKHLFPDYTTSPAAPPRIKKMQAAALTAAEKNLPAAAATVEPADLPRCASDFGTALKRVVSDAAANEDALPLRELLGLNEALQRTCGALVDNLARLSQLDGDITQAEQQLEGEEAANDPEKSGAYRNDSLSFATSVHLA